MDKRYQVFVSSTFADLEEERRQIIETLIEINYIPAGMELFPAADEEQLKFIKKIIDYCDYYLLIVSGKYGSLTSDGVSYTEKEYDYAIERGMKVIALLHKNPDTLPTEKSEGTAELKEKLARFREKISNGRIVKFWNSTDELIQQTMFGLNHAINEYPATGWVRADKVPREELLEEINDLRKENKELKTELESHIKSNQIDIPDLAPLDETILISGTWYNHGSNIPWETTISWKDIFGIIAPYALNVITESDSKFYITQGVFTKSGVEGQQPYLADSIFQTIKIQFLAHKLILARYSKTQVGSWDWFWSLTPKGESLMMELRAVRSRKI